MNHCIITTINYPTKAIEKLYDKFGDKLIVVGDKKTPTDWEYKNVTYLPFKDDGYACNHYARKNIGYLEAMRSGATLIYEGDDDNIPNNEWRLSDENIVADISKTEGWFNVYNLFTDEHIWPRGFSLKHINKQPMHSSAQKVKSSVHQGMADLDPDVDAIWRLVFNTEVNFVSKRSVFLRKGAWCPFNSQNTFWFPRAYPLMYLPVYASFRMTDIFRSFVAQRCLWEVNDGICFHSPATVYQERNGHDLLSDFKDEISGYLNNDLFVETLERLTLKTGEENICSNMLTCYLAVVDKGILPEMEIRSLKKWIKEYENIKKNLE